MPALRGSLTYVRYFVVGTVPDDFRERFMRSIRHRAMKPLEVDDEDLERSGWCKIGDAFALELTYDDVFFNEFVNLGLRTDRWVIPGSTLRSRMKDAEKAYLEKKGREKMSRKEKTELKELVSRRLRRETSPTTRMVDVSWAVNDGMIRFFSHGTRPAAQLLELFQKTFGTHGLTLVPEAPYTAAARFADGGSGLSKSGEKAWEDLTPLLLAEED